MPEPGETFQTVESALSLCRQDTEASGAEVSSHPGPGAGTLMEPGPTPVLWAPFRTPTARLPRSSRLWASALADSVGGGFYPCIFQKRGQAQRGGPWAR